MRRLAVILAAASSVALFACSDDKDSDTTTTEASVDAGSGNECTAGNTLSDGVLTIGTGSPAYSPWVIDDAPESKEGFEAAVAYAIAEELGHDIEDVYAQRAREQGLREAYGLADHQFQGVTNPPNGSLPDPATDSSSP